MAESPRRRRVLSDKQQYDALRRARKSGAADMDALRKEFEFGASPHYTGEQFRQDLRNVGATVSAGDDGVQDFEAFEEEKTVSLGEIQHTPTRERPDQQHQHVNVLQEAPIVDAILLDDDTEGQT